MDFLSQEQLAEYQGVFALFDKEGRGVITFEDIKAGMIAMKMHPKDSDIRKMMKEADASKTGSIDFTEFAAVLTNKLGKLDSEDEILRAFNTFDRQDIGLIPREELRTALTTLGNKLSEKEIRDILKEGTDEEGMFDYEKFVQVMVGKRKEVVAN
eukprot:CAMPEP_0174250552 /NCGR_PEP_ID=MMETSP0439-20130205/693_1 /TAXON_ID=0 /ORGANISM="Stereomyxa ramosa, Strain Chinc5" /LENGTH=154 /DNA_ID=CAMNT_0015330665 /DNA_START=21 /DNA_END=485 /DNA_ORIENTATION=+